MKNQKDDLLRIYKLNKRNMFLQGISLPLCIFNYIIIASNGMFGFYDNLFIIISITIFCLLYVKFIFNIIYNFTILKNKGYFFINPSLALHAYLCLGKNVNCLPSFEDVAITPIMNNPDNTQAFLNLLEFFKSQKIETSKRINRKALPSPL
jgi:hypothetical protein